MLSSHKIWTQCRKCESPLISLSVIKRKYKVLGDYVRHGRKNIERLRPGVNNIKVVCAKKNLSKKSQILQTSTVIYPERPTITAL